MKKRKTASPARSERSKPIIGLALGSGSARGWAHIGAIQALEELGIRPQLVCGSSIGALVGAAMVCGNLKPLEEWARGLKRSNFLSIVDFRLPESGLMQGERLMDLLGSFIPDISIEDMSMPFGAVATDLATGREVWLREGSLRRVVRSTIAIPGLFTPARWGDQWLLDGGLVNPVPVSLCRALGAELVIGINPFGDRGARFSLRNGSYGQEPDAMDQDLMAEMAGETPQAISHRASRLWSQLKNRPQKGPGMMEVVMQSINIMQDRITRSRMAGDPPEVLVAPRLSHVTLLEFHRADEAIAEGRAAVERMLPALKDAVGL